MAQPIGSQIGNAPELPSIPDLNTRLADYLRRFALWSQGNFNSCIQKRSATGELFMHSVSGQSVWSLTVDDSGRLQTTQILPGSHQASVGATLTFAPITKYGESAIANPTGTTSTTYVMMGCGITFGPSIETAIWVTVDGQITNSSNNSETDVVICWGTGAAPANGAPQTGTIEGQPARYKATAAGDFTPFSLTQLIQNLQPNASYWLDIAVKAVTGGTARVMDLDFNAHGLA